MTNKPTRKNSTAGSLETYLKTCQVNQNGEYFDVYNFDDVPTAYEFGQRLRKLALEEEGVDFTDQLQRFNIDISYTTVRIKLNVVELARC